MPYDDISTELLLEDIEKISNTSNVGGEETEFFRASDKLTITTNEQILSQAIHDGKLSKATTFCLYGKETSATVINDKMMQSFFTNIPHKSFEKLQVLELQNNHLTEASINVLIQAIEQNTFPNLKTLRLNGNNFSEVSLIKITNAIQNNLPLLKEANLGEVQNTEVIAKFAQITGVKFVVNYDDDTSYNLYTDLVNFNKAIKQAQDKDIDNVVIKSLGKCYNQDSVQYILNQYPHLKEDERVTKILKENFEYAETTDTSSSNNSYVSANNVQAPLTTYDIPQYTTTHLNPAPFYKEHLKSDIEYIVKSYSDNHSLVKLREYTEVLFKKYNLENDIDAYDFRRDIMSKFNLPNENKVIAKELTEVILKKYETIFSNINSSEINLNEEIIKHTIKPQTTLQDILNAKESSVREQVEEIVNSLNTHWQEKISDGVVVSKKYDMPPTLATKIDAIYKLVKSDFTSPNHHVYAGPKNKTDETKIFEDIMIPAILEDMKHSDKRSGYENGYIPKVTYSVQNKQLFFKVNDYEMSVDKFLQKVDFNHVNLTQESLSELVPNIKKFIPHREAKHNVSVDEINEIIKSKDPNNLNGLIKYTKYNHDDGSNDSSNAIIDTSTNLLAWGDLIYKLYTNTNQCDINFVLRDHLNNTSDGWESEQVCKMANATIAMSTVIAWVASQIPVGQTRIDHSTTPGNLDYIEHNYTTRFETVVDTRLQELKKYCETNEITRTHAPLSTSVGSWLPDFAHNSNSLFIVFKGLTGPNLNDISCYNSENEILMPPHTQVQWQGYMDFSNNNHVIIADVVNDVSISGEAATE